MRTSTKVIGVLLLLTLIPAWRSGLKTKMNFWQFTVNHTVWGDPVEYVPEEKYEELAP